MVTSQGHSQRMRTCEDDYDNSKGRVWQLREGGTSLQAIPVHGEIDKLKVELTVCLSLPIYTTSYTCYRLTGAMRGQCVQRQDQQEAINEREHEVTVHIKWK
jgi:hypothetical protein